MNKKVTLDYDSVSGMIFDSTGNCVGTWIGLQPYDEVIANKDALALALKYAGMADDSIMKLVDK